MVKIIKTLRITAWILIALTALTLLSGFLSVKPSALPWLPKVDSYYLHVVVLPLLFVPIIYLHSLMGILLFFSRNPKYDKVPLKSAAAGLWTALFILFGFLYFVPAAVPEAVNSPAASAQTTLAAAEIARHSTASDCWIIIGGKVYDVSGYATEHPGGAQNIESFCGKDGTEAFATKGEKGQPHSDSAQQFLSSMYLGDMGSNISKSVLEKARSVQFPVQSEDEGDDD
ncbi:MAG: cytochrome b5-like heme/steroid binding domain-containing protein [Candidatus Paceibacterota bacterium]|jgi:cytochrome b involved in lipid metabolism|nr:cytochrome b5 domain-containing protein [Candidatus Paceibacterota bacterium]